MIREYQLISEHYGDRCAERSGVRLMQHIDEGLEILDELGAADYVKAAFCLHPLLQSPEAYKENIFWLAGDTMIGVSAFNTALEYRRKANAYLCTPATDGWEVFPDVHEAVGVLLQDMRQMLLADKRQNQKDFLLYHQGTHPRSEQLTRYFENWLEYLS